MLDTQFSTLDTGSSVKKLIRKARTRFTYDNLDPKFSILDIGYSSRIDMPNKSDNSPSLPRITTLGCSYDLNLRKKYFFTEQYIPQGGIIGQP